MPCSGCAKRRQKIAAAYSAVKQGFNSAKSSYSKQARAIDRPRPKLTSVTDIREKQA